MTEARNRDRTDRDDRDLREQIPPLTIGSASGTLVFTLGAAWVGEANRNLAARRWLSQRTRSAGC